MGYVLFLIGLILFVAGIRGTHKDLLGLIIEDVTGNTNFLWWISAIAFLGALGYVKTLRPISTAFMSLVLVALVLANQGVFANFTAAIRQARADTGFEPVQPIVPNADFSVGENP